MSRFRWKGYDLGGSGRRDPCGRVAGLRRKVCGFRGSGRGVSGGRFAGAGAPVAQGASFVLLFHRLCRLSWPRMGFLGVRHRIDGSRGFLCAPGAPVALWGVFAASGGSCGDLARVPDRISESWSA